MTPLQRIPGRLGALLALGLAACSGEQGGGALFIESCSLGCSSGNGGAQVFCAVVNTPANQELKVLFSEPIDESSITNQTFRVLNTANGSTPLGEVFVDHTNPRQLIFRPALTFDSAGNPVFGFAENTSYQFLIPGASQGGNGPFLRSTRGRENQSRLECTVLTDQGIIDPVQGAPSIVSIVVTVVTATDVDGNPTAFQELTLEEAAAQALPVWRRSPVVITFDEPMNPATLFNPTDGSSSSMLMRLDVDGDLETSADRLNISGRWDVDTDLDAGRSVATFLHEVPNVDGTGFLDTAGFPSSGEDPNNPRLVTLRLTSTISDIVGEKLVEGSEGLLFSFTPESIPQPPQILPGGVEEDGDPFASAGRETFSDDSLENQDRSGALWGGGRLQWGRGGGSGRLGELIVAAGQTVTLRTDADEVFPRDGDPFNVVFTPEELFDQQNNGAPAEITVSDGVFEFSRLVIQAGGRLRLEGTNPARIFVRGPVSIPATGIIDISGGTPENHDSRHPDPMTNWVSQVGGAVADAVVPGLGGPGAGDGGFGGARWRFDVGTGINSVGGANTTQLPTWVQGDTDGRVGDSVTGFAVTSGQGGVRFPQGPYPTGTGFAASGDVAVNQLSGLDFFPGEFMCLVRMAGGSGSGGGYAMEGGDGSTSSPQELWDFPFPAGSNNAPDTTGGARVPDFEAGQAEEANFLNTGYDLRTLDPNAGNLRGGSGGGGGGSHPFFAYYNGFQNLSDCNFNSNLANFTGPNGNENGWVDHSGASGGGGGGALQLCSGSEIELNGIIDASGGNGGSNLGTGDEDRAGAWAMPGGGGSGGAVLLQGYAVAVSPTPGRIDVSGGQGGTTTGIVNLGTGGEGGPGLVRIETAEGNGPDPTGADHDVFDQSITPFDGGGDFGVFAVELLSVDPGGFTGSDSIPDSYSASVSCWIQPPGNYLNINFTDDPDANPDDDDPSDLGWNMHVVWDDGGGETLIPFRGDAGGALAANLLEILRRNDLNQDQADPALRAPIAVRFQAATLVGELLDPCGTGLEPPIDVSSLTGWVEHPAELNPTGNEPLPDVFRFAVFFDRSLVGTAELDTIDQNLRGVDNLWIRANPD